MEPSTLDRAWGIIRRVLIGACVVGGSALVLLALVAGDCGFAGGTCPADPPPLGDDDVFRFAALGAALAVGPPVFLARPSARRAGAAVAAAVGAAVLVGVIGRSVAYG